MATTNPNPNLHLEYVGMIVEIAGSTAALAAWSRGSPLAEKWDGAATDAIEDLVIAAVRREQQSSRRRRPFSSRSGYTPF